MFTNKQLFWCIGFHAAFVFGITLTRELTSVNFQSDFLVLISSCCLKSRKLTKNKSVSKKVESQFCNMLSYVRNALKTAILLVSSQIFQHNMFLPKSIFIFVVFWGSAGRAEPLKLNSNSNIIYSIHKILI